MTRARAFAVTCVVLTAAVLAAVRPAHASLTQLTQSTQIFSNPNLVKFDAAYDPTNKVYLVVWGRTQPGPINGIFLNSQGQPVSGIFSVSVPNGFTAGWARVVYGAQSGFLVTYTKAIGSPLTAVTLYARFVRYSGGNPDFVTGELEVQQLGVGHPGSDEGVAYVSSTGGYVSGFWLNPAFPQSYIKSIRPEGIGPAVPVTDGLDGSSDPEITCNAAANRCLVVGFSWGTPFVVNGRYTGATWGRVVDATTLQPISPNNTYVSGGARAENQSLVFSPAANQFVVAWVQNYREVIGRNVDTNFGMGGLYVMRAGSTSNGNDCAYGYGQLNHALASNTGAGALAVGVVDWCGRAWIQELNADGTPGADFKMVDGLPTIENNPVLVPNNEDKQYLYLHNYQIAAPRTVLYSTTGSGPPPPPPPPPPGKPQPTSGIDLAPERVPNGSWFLAEGATNNQPGGFMTYYLIANENAVPVEVRVYYASDDGRLLTETLTVAAGGRYTIDLRDRTGGGSFATIFQSLTAGHDIFVERSMYWGTNFEGSHGVTAVKDLHQSWLFPEGSRGGEYFTNYFMLFNPYAVAAPVTARFYLNDGTVVALPYTVPALGRLTLNANQIPELAGRDFATGFTSAIPIMAERAMYWGAPWHGGTASVGVPAPWHVWHFAEGAAQIGFETFYLILNPNPVAIDVRATFLQEDGTTHVRDFTVGANTRETFFLNQQLGNIGAAAAVFETSPGTPMAVERAVYWGAGRVDGTTSIGARRAAFEWHLPEGVASNMFDTFMMLSNASHVPVAVDITLFIEGLGQFTLPAEMRPVMAPQSRKTIHMNGLLQQIGQQAGVNLSTASFATRVRVVGSVAGIVAEHVIYWNRDGANFWRSGAGAFGVGR